MYNVYVCIYNMMIILIISCKYFFFCHKYCVTCIIIYICSSLHLLFMYLSLSFCSISTQIQYHNLSNIINDHKYIDRIGGIGFQFGGGTVVFFADCLVHRIPVVCIITGARCLCHRHPTVECCFRCSCCRY